MYLFLPINFITRYGLIQAYDGLVTKCGLPEERFPTGRKDHSDLLGSTPESSCISQPGFFILESNSTVIRYSRGADILTAVSET